jgi:steroid delta-isomerase-like uncharacterized protein
MEYQNMEIEQLRLETNKAIVRRAHDEVWTKGNMAAIDELYAPDYVAHWFIGDDMGLDEFKDMLKGTRTAFPDLTEEIMHIVAEGDLVVTHFISSGTLMGEFDGIPPTGKRGSRPEIAFHRIEDEKIVEQWTVADRLSLLSQLDILSAATETG